VASGRVDTTLLPFAASICPTSIAPHPFVELSHGALT
jgi:hypothetical protein